MISTSTIMLPDIADHDVVVCPIIVGVSPECPEILSDDERKTAARKMRAPDRASFVACRTFLRRLLAHDMGCAPSRVSIRVTDKGKPEAKGSDLSFSISHTTGLSLVAVTRGRRLGIDLERRDRQVDAGLLEESPLPGHRDRDAADVLGCDGNALFLADWTRQEALAKATGQGLVFGADDVLLDETVWDDLVVKPFEGSPAHIVSVAADGPEWRPRWGGLPEMPEASLAGMHFTP